MSVYSVRSLGTDSCVCIGIGESGLYGFSGYRGGPEPFHIGGLHCIVCTVFYDNIIYENVTCIGPYFIECFTIRKYKASYPRKLQAKIQKLYSLLDLFVFDKVLSRSMQVLI